MPLTTQQLATLKAAILAETDATFVALRAATDETGMAAWYNAPTSPAFIVWRRDVKTPEIGPVLNWVAVANLTTANRDRATTFVMLNPSQFNASADIAAYWDTTFGGSLGGEGANTRAALQALWRRTANRVERLFATGTGTDATPGFLGWEGIISAQDISDALRV
jgi:hypothetical protein